LDVRNLEFATLATATATRTVSSSISISISIERAFSVKRAKAAVGGKGS